MVHELTMPHAFMTLTADEVIHACVAWSHLRFVSDLCLIQNSSMRWEEVADMEHILKQFNKDFTWIDAPVEMVQHFDARVKAFMDDYIIKQQLIGKVEHWILRYVFQVTSHSMLLVLQITVCSMDLCI